jgi:hypothetical protein
MQPAWLYRGTGLRRGSEVTALFAGEMDSYYTTVPHPAGVVVIGQSPGIPCNGGRAHADSTFYVAGSGAGVFDAGSLGFDCGLGPSLFGCSPKHVDPRLQHLVGNLIAAMLSRTFH